MDEGAYGLSMRHVGAGARLATVMRAPMRPRAVAGDVVETLVSLDAVAAMLGGSVAGRMRWGGCSPRVLRYGFALVTSCAYKPFREPGRVDARRSRPFRRPTTRSGCHHDCRPIAVRP